MITSSVLRQEVLRTVLREALNRYRNELLDDGKASFSSTGPSVSGVSSKSGHRASKRGAE